MKIKILLGAISATFLAASSASAQTVIYYDQFSYYPNQINGEQPDTVDTGVDGGTPGAVWIAPSQWVAIDTAPDTPPSEASAVSQYANAYLPFTPIPGLIYTLSASLAGGRDDLVDLGFTEYDTLNTNFAAPNAFTEEPPEPNAGPWIQLADDAGEVYVYPGPGYANPPSNSPAVIGSEPDNPAGIYSIVLDTETPDWTYSVTGPDGFSTGPLTFPGGNPTINYVGIGNFDDDGTDAGFVDDFQLTVVPEPSAYMLLCLGGLALFMVSRRRVSRLT